MYCVFLCLITALFLIPQQSHAWGRHDFITKLAIENADLKRLEDLRVAVEPIENAAPDFLRRAIPLLMTWSKAYHDEHDLRYPWVNPEPPSAAFGKPLNDRESFLWFLENNIQAPLASAEKGKSISALEILTRYSDEPDSHLDEGFHVSPYLERLRPQMSLFFEGNEHTHTFRHYFVPKSWIPPLLSARGIAPYRAALYARLAVLAFRTGHRYWGFRFLAWSIHHAQDVTQPWHTVFVPSLDFLSYSKERIKKKIAGYHYLTEAFSDTMLMKNFLDETARVEPELEVLWSTRNSNPFFVAQLAEKSAELAQKRIHDLNKASSPIFDPILKVLDFNLRPISSKVKIGNRELAIQELDFNGNGAKATKCLMPLWDEGFSLRTERERLAKEVTYTLSLSLRLTRMIIFQALEESTELQKVPKLEIQSAIYKRN